MKKPMSKSKKNSVVVAAVVVPVEAVAVPADVAAFLAAHGLTDLAVLAASLKKSATREKASRVSSPRGSSYCEAVRARIAALLPSHGDTAIGRLLVTEAAAGDTVALDAAEQPSLRTADLAGADAKKLSKLAWHCRAGSGVARPERTVRTRSVSARSVSEAIATRAAVERFTVRMIDDSRKGQEGKQAYGFFESSVPDLPVKTVRKDVMTQSEVSEVCLRANRLAAMPLAVVQTQIKSAVGAEQLAAQLAYAVLSKTA